MNSYYKIFGIGLLACLMSCSEQEIIEEQSQGSLVTATAVNSGSSVFSRLAFEDKQEDDGGVGVTWADGDKFYMEGGNGAFAEMAIVSGQGQKTAQFTGVLAGGTLAENEAVDVYYPSSVYDKQNECFNVDFRTITQDCTTGNEMNHLSATYLMTGNGIKREDGVYVSFVGGTKVSMLRFDLTLPKQTTSNLTITELQIVCEDLKTVGTLATDGTFTADEFEESHRQKVVLNNLAASTTADTKFSVYVNVLPVKITGKMRLKAMLSDETVYWCDVDLTNVELKANNRYYLVRGFLEEQKVGVDYSWYDKNKTPLIISNEAQLRALVHIVNATYPTGKNYPSDNFAGQTILLDNDIDLKVDWIPLGCYKNNSREFKGNLNGQNYKISGLFYDDNHTVDVRQVGFIGRANGSVIENLTIQGRIKTKIQNVAGLVGRTSGVTIKNCRNEVDVFSFHKGSSGGYSNVGGIVGYGSDTSFLIKCSNAGHIENSKTSYGRIGGLFGGLDIDASVIMACLNEGIVSSLKNNDIEDVIIGGIVGMLEPGLSYKKNVYIVANSNLGDIKGNENKNRFVGGLMGANYRSGGEVNVDIYGCYSLFDPLCLSGKSRDRVMIDESCLILTQENKNSREQADLLNIGILKWNAKEDGVNGDVNHAQYCNYHFEVGDTHLVLKEGAPSAPTESETEGEQ